MNKRNSVLPGVWLLFLLAGFPQLSETIYSPALPAIASSLHASSNFVQWTLSIYFVGFALGVFYWGRLSDKKGRRPVMLFGLCLYTLASILCLFSKNIDWLLFSRLLQGFGASAGSVITQTIARESLHDKQRHRFFSMAGFAIAFSIALGPFLGGYITQWFGWQANFLVLVLLGFSLIVMAFSCLPETLDANNHKKQKIIIVFLALLKDKHVLSCAWLVGVVNGLLFCYFAEAPFIFIHMVSLSASQYGLLSIGIAIAAFLGTISSRYLINAMSVSRLIVLGASFMFLGSLLLTCVALIGWVSAAHPLMSVLLIMLPLMIIIYGGFGFVIPMTLSTALQKHQAVLGAAGAWFGLSYYILVALFTWGMGLIQNGTLFPMPIYFLILSASALWVSIRINRGNYIN